MYPTDERLPFDGCELEDWPLAVLGVADRDPTIVNERNVDAAVVLAVGALAPFSLREICHVHRLLFSALRRFLGGRAGWSVVGIMAAAVSRRYLETAAGQRYDESGDVAHRYNLIFDRLQEAALKPKESVRALTDAIRALRGDDS